MDNLIFLGEVRATLQEWGADSLSVRQSRLVITGLTLPAGSRELLRSATGATCTLPSRAALPGLRSDERGLRQAVREVLDDILALFGGERALQAARTSESEVRS